MCKIKKHDNPAYLEMALIKKLKPSFNAQYNSKNDFEEIIKGLKEEKEKNTILVIADY